MKPQKYLLWRESETFCWNPENEKQFYGPKTFCATFNQSTVAFTRIQCRFFLPDLYAAVEWLKWNLWNLSWQTDEVWKVHVNDARQRELNLPQRKVRGEKQNKNLRERNAAAVESKSSVYSIYWLRYFGIDNVEKLIWFDSSEHRLELRGVAD